MPKNKIHVCVGFYLNGDYVVNHVADEHLAANIEYNRTYRFGRFYFVDGEYACGGALIPKEQEKFIAKCKARLAELAIEPADRPSETYR